MNSAFLDQIRKIVVEEKNWSGIPGVTLALLHGDEEAVICEGWRDREKQLPVTPHTRFVIASCSKSMTTAMLGCLVDEGILNWDTPVRHYVPELQMMDSEANDQMTLRDMCLHRTGLADHDGMWPNPEGRKVLAERLRHIEPNLRFREKYQYNNVIYSLVAYVAEKVTGKSYEQLMRSRILEPLGMEETFINHGDFIRCEDIAEPYYWKNEKEGIVRQEKWNMDASAAAAAIATSARDMLRWLRFNVSGGFGPDGKRILSQKSWDVIHHAGIAGREDTPRAFAHYDGYGFGWWEGTYRGHAIYKHTGKINGYSSVEILLPDLQAGIFVSQNLHVPEKHLYYRAAYTAVDYWLGIPNAGADWEYAYHGEESCPKELHAACHINQMPEKSRNPLPPTRPLGDYTGIYKHPGYGSIRITLEKGELTSSHRIYRCRLTCYDGDIFQADEFWEDVKNITMPFHFVFKNGEKKPSELIIPMEIQVKPVHFIRQSSQTEAQTEIESLQ